MVTKVRKIHEFSFKELADRLQIRSISSVRAGNGVVRIETEEMEDIPDSFGFSVRI